MPLSRPSPASLPPGVAVNHFDLSRPGASGESQSRSVSDERRDWGDKIELFLSRKALEGGEGTCDIQYIIDVESEEIRLGACGRGTTWGRASGSLRGWKLLVRTKLASPRGTKKHDPPSGIDRIIEYAYFSPAFYL